jgi:hypothetical protein
MAKSQNLEVKDIRTKDGNLRFGHIHQDQTKSSVMLQGQGSLEFISIEQVGLRPGWIWSRCRGRYQIVCGDNIPENDVAYLLNTTGGDGFSKGNIEIKTNGTFKVQAENIQLIANGPDNSTGYIILKANERIELKSEKQIIINANEAMSLYASDLNTTAQNIMKMAAGSFQKLSSSSSLLGITLPVSQKLITSFLGAEAATQAVESVAEEDLFSAENTRLTGNETSRSFASGGASSGGALAE